MDNTIDLLQIKIEKAKAELPEDTQNAINAVDWKAVVLGMREKRGYSFEQLEDLEVETELVLCGLLSPENYSKELEKRLGLQKTEVNDLVKEMNNLVFTKIKENLVKIIERKKAFIPDTEEKKNNTQILKSAGIEIIPASPTGGPEKLELATPETPPILVQKLSGYVKNEVIETKHSLENITKTAPTSYPPKEDPYRLPPE